MPVDYPGNPNNFPAEIQIPDGSDAPSSTLFATPYEGLADRTACLRANTPNPGQSWQPAFAGENSFWPAGTSLPNGGNFYKPCFDTWENVWVLPTSAGLLGNYEVLGSWSFGQDGAGAGGAAVSVDAGAVHAWSPVSSGNLSGGSGETSGIPDVAMCSGFTSGQLLGVAINKGLGTVALIQVTYTAEPTTLATLSVTGWTECEIATIGTNVLVGLGHSTSGGAGAVYSVPQASPAFSGAAISGPADCGWRLAKGTVTPSVGSPFPRVVCAPTLQNSTTLWTTDDGVTFTSVSISSILPSGTGIINSWISGVCWSAALELFFMVITAEGSHNTMWVYSSPDGQTWTQTNPSHQPILGTTPGVNANDIAAIGSGLVVITNDQTTFLGSQYTSFVAHSQDGGVTWYQAGVAFQGNQAMSGGEGRLARLASSGSQLFATNASQARFSVPGSALPAAL